MKRLFALVLSFCMALSIGVCAAAAETPLRENENGVLLSSLDYEECRNFLLNQGVSIPEELSGIDLPKLFADLESNPDMVSGSMVTDPGGSGYHGAVSPRQPPVAPVGVAALHPAIAVSAASTAWRDSSRGMLGCPGLSSTCSGR